jgi:CRISPR-associated protein Cas2
MFTVISYDVVQDKPRTGVSKLLCGYGTRVQYSVFECDLNASQLARVQQAIRALIDPHTDSVRFYFLDPGAVRAIQIMGIGRVSTIPPYYLIGGGPEQTH